MLGNADAIAAADTDSRTYTLERTRTLKVTYAGHGSEACQQGIPSIFRACRLRIAASASVDGRAAAGMH
jgi:hypothetical protein